MRSTKVVIKRYDDGRLHKVEIGKVKFVFIYRNMDVRQVNIAGGGAISIADIIQLSSALRETEFYKKTDLKFVTFDGSFGLGQEFIAVVEGKKCKIYGFVCLNTAGAAGLFNLVGNGLTLLGEVDTNAYGQGVSLLVNPPTFLWETIWRTGQTNTGINLRSSVNVTGAIFYWLEDL